MSDSDDGDAKSEEVRFVLRVDKEVYEAFRVYAKYEGRSINAQLVRLMRGVAEQHQREISRSGITIVRTPERTPERRP